MDKKDLIQKFLANKCSAQEAELAAQILELEPELLNGHLPEEEWQEIGDAGIKTDTVLKEEIWQGIKLQTRQGKIYNLFLKAAAVAAGVILLTTAMLYINTSRKAPVQQIANYVISPDSLQLVQNNSDNITTIKLEDGSEVMMYPRSSIKYSLNFKNNRTIQLISGKAGFDVAKDPGHPFTVLSGKISTTALGTRFIVNHDGNKVNVRLYEGKVVVKSLAAQTPIEPAFLTPGEQCIINIKMNDIAIGPLTNELLEDGLQKSKDISVKHPGSSGVSMKFYNTPLTEVLEQLKIVFNRPIVYNAKEMERMFFTGQFNSGDSITSILRTLASTNGLCTNTESDIIKITRLTTAKLPENTTAARVLSKNNPIKNNKPAAPPNKLTGTTLTFASTPLQQVFTEIASKFHVNIQFQAEDIKGKYFTGTITPTDDPQKILSLICGMNQLQMIRHSNGYQVMK